MRLGSDARRLLDDPAMNGRPGRARSPSAGDPRTPANGRVRPTASPWALAIVLVLVYVAVMVWVAQHRMVGDYLKETDFYHLYAPDADRIRSGQPPANTFNTGPAYPLFLALAFPLTGDNFAAGKYISLVAAIVTALAAFQLFRGLFGDRAGCLGLVFLLVSADFARFSVQATTDMPFLAIVVLAVLAISRAANGGGWMWGVAGGLSGLAYLIRYNGLFLVPTGLFAVHTSGRWTAPRLRHAALFVLGALAVVSPWLLLARVCTARRSSIAPMP
jgi:4-amino-4-deoxy-L-arabinose transferase-like glycosyltransferase